MESTCKHFALALLSLLFLIMSCQAEKRPNITTDQSALFAFKAHITSDPHQFLSKNWSVASSICDWIGVTCGSRHRRVTTLNISSMGLIGTIPPHLGNLSFLVSLDLKNNSFNGNLPHELAQMRRLKFLNLGNNDLSDEFPRWLGSLGELQHLSLANNSFHGLISPSFSNLSKLETLRLGFNSFQGMIPTEIGNLHNLKVLILEDNQFSGSLPLAIFNISTLEIITYRGNTLSGGLPEQICHHLPRLERLALSENKLSGHIPPNLSQCSKLKHLELFKNNFSGVIPKEIGNLEMLQGLRLNDNNLTGGIPKEIGNLTMLYELCLHNNKLTGVVPDELGKLHKLEKLYLNYNSLSGHIPIGVFNLSRLERIDLGNNSFSGHLPSNIGYALPNLVTLSVFGNYLSGIIPNSISNSSKLTRLLLSYNNFNGSIPQSLGDLHYLQQLAVAGNNLTSKSPSQELDFFNFLSKCKDLRWLAVNENPLEGLLSASVGNLSKTIERIYAYECKIKGSIPDAIGNLSNLIVLSLFGNQLTGRVPTTIQGLQKLQLLDLSHNKLSGSVLHNICGLQQLCSLYLSGNKISGSIPNCLGNIRSLRFILIGSNRLNSSIPENIWHLKNLLELNLSSNSLSGSLPLKVNLKVANHIDLSWNYFEGDFPSSVGDLKNLIYLSLEHNSFQGPIPESIDKLRSLEYLDLSHNNLSGSIPRSLEMLLHLKYFDVSFNELRGEIPSRGSFQNFTSDSFASNEALCGPPKFNVPPCPTMPTQTFKRKVVFLLVGITVIIGSIALGVYLRYRRKDKVPSGTILPSMMTQERISFYELLHATNGYDESNLLGRGSFGNVYKGTLGDGRVLAIKVFNLQVKRAFKSFEAECQVMRSIRHRNLTKVISSCSNPDFKALVLEFMPNGSLEKWLYSHNYFLDIMQRLNIMIDVAWALQYLHFGNSASVVHCDLKPSNVLLDQDMVAHVSDFGIAKMLDEEQSNAYTKTLATLGYIAPEYGSEGLLSTKCDVYSYGILLMEVFTRKKPSDQMFHENMSLRDWVNDSIPNAFVQVIDANLLKTGEEYFTEKVKCLLSIIEVGLNCSMRTPRERSNMEYVLAALRKIKLQLLPLVTDKSRVIFSLNARNFQV